MACYMRLYKFFFHSTILNKKTRACLRAHTLLTYAGYACSEMLVAGYMKFMENDFMGLTNATQETRAIMAKYGQDGVHFDGHSRGAMTTGNALESLAKDKTQLGQLPSLTVNFIGPAYNASKADNLLSSLQGRENMSPEQAAAAELKYQSHQADTVGGLIGWNKPTGGNLSEGKAIWQE